MKPKASTFHMVLAEFCAYPKTDDLTLDFFNFLEERYPIVWRNLNAFYADDESGTDPEHNRSNSRIHLFGWDDIVRKGSFDLFIPAIQREWLWLTGATEALCTNCDKVREVAFEHQLIASWDFVPTVKIYRARAMDGSQNMEELICRECAVKLMKRVIEVSDPKEMTCRA